MQKGLDPDQGVDCNGNQDLDPDQGLVELDKGLDQDQVDGLVALKIRCQEMKRRISLIY